MGTVPELFIWGVQDGFSPLHLGVYALFLACCIALSRNKKALLWFSGIFVLATYMLSLSTLLGFMATLVLNIWFFNLTACLFFVLGLILWLLGGKFLLNWLREMRGGSSVDTSVAGILQPFAKFLKGPAAAICAIIFVFALLVWPPNFYVTLIVNEATIPGKERATIAMAALYTFFKILILPLSAIVILVLNGHLGVSVKLSFRRSTLLILLSAFYLAVGIGVIYIVIKQLI